MKNDIYQTLNPQDTSDQFALNAQTQIEPDQPKAYTLAQPGSDASPFFTDLNAALITHGTTHQAGYFGLHTWHKADLIGGLLGERAKDDYLKSRQEMANQAMEQVSAIPMAKNPWYDRYGAQIMGGLLDPVYDLEGVAGAMLGPEIVEPLASAITTGSTITGESVLPSVVNRAAAAAVKGASIGATANASIESVDEALNHQFDPVAYAKSVGDGALMGGVLDGALHGAVDLAKKIPIPDRLKNVTQGVSSNNLEDMANHAAKRTHGDSLEIFQKTSSPTDPDAIQKANEIEQIANQKLAEHHEAINNNIDTIMNNLDSDNTIHSYPLPKIRSLTDDLTTYAETFPEDVDTDKIGALNQKLRDAIPNVGAGKKVNDIYDSDNRVEFANAIDDATNVNNELEKNEQLINRSNLTEDNKQALARRIEAIKSLRDVPSSDLPLHQNLNELSDQINKDALPIKNYTDAVKNYSPIRQNTNVENEAMAALNATQRQAFHTEIPPRIDDDPADEPYDQTYTIKDLKDQVNDYRNSGLIDDEMYEESTAGALERQRKSFDGIKNFLGHVASCLYEFGDV